MRLRYQPDDNSLRLTLDQEPSVRSQRVEIDAYVDVGEGGRLIGVEPLAGPGIDLRVALSLWLSDPIAAEYVSIQDSTAYIELSAPDETDLREHQRTAEATLTAELDDSGQLLALSIPRRGAGYEISYPSGNR